MPRGVYPRKQRSNRRQEILQAAARVYARHGFEGSTIERMAREAGVSKALLGEYFGDKQALVKAIAEWAVAENRRELQKIDKAPGLTLRRREWRIHDWIRGDREMWCLILGTLLVPSFQFAGREEMAGLQAAANRAVMAHRNELKDPTPAAAQAYAHTAVSLQVQYVHDGAEPSFHMAMEQLQEIYLLPEGGEQHDEKKRETDPPF